GAGGRARGRGSRRARRGRRRGRGGCRGWRRGRRGDCGRVVSLRAYELRVGRSVLRPCSLPVRAMRRWFDGLTTNGGLSHHEREVGGAVAYEVRAIYRSLRTVAQLRAVTTVVLRAARSSSTGSFARPRPFGR